MAGTETEVVRLSDLEDGREGEFFAALVKREHKTTSNKKSYYLCYFRDRRIERVAPVWSDDPFMERAAAWTAGMGFRIRAKLQDHPKYGLQLKLIECREVVEDDVADGYDPADLFPASRFEPGSRYLKILEFIKLIQHPELARLVREILEEHSELFARIQAATGMHHAYIGGLSEHVWSVTRVCHGLLKHYSAYYDNLNPPIDYDLTMAAAILHDIGKLRELEYHPVEAKFTKLGSLVGHIVLGRDMVREKARQIGDFPEETLLLLEHAILAHHGQKEYGAPVEPATIEALILHHADVIDAKINAVVAQRLIPSGEEFTAKVYSLKNQRFYRGIPLEAAVDEMDGPPASV
jgi:3'-5' exoribonuclease